MPVRVRSKRGHVRTSLTEAEEVELLIGAADRPSLFADALDYALARDLLDADLAERSAMDHLIKGKAILVELDRRHRQHWTWGADDPEAPATFDGMRCARCNPRGFDLFMLRGESLHAPVEDDAQEPLR